VSDPRFKTPTGAGMTRLTFPADMDLRRGDYAHLSGFSARHSGWQRVVTVGSSTTLTTRDVHRWSLVEWCHARLEDWLLWPLADFRNQGIPE